VEKESHFQYGFNLNLCVCKDGRKIDMNPRKEKKKSLKALKAALAAKRKREAKKDNDEEEEEEKKDEAASDDDDEDNDDAGDNDDEKPGNYGPAGSGDHHTGKRRPQYAKVSATDVQRLHKEKGCTIQVLHPQQYRSTVVTLSWLFRLCSNAHI
jgi:archaellum component FlaD/FlaE